MNCKAHSLLLEAERHALLKNKSKAVETYRKAILVAGRSGMLQLQALANERLTEYLFEMSEADDAKYTLAEAMKLYAEWGAMAKLTQLRKKYRSLCDGFSKAGNYQT